MTDRTERLTQMKSHKIVELPLLNCYHCYFPVICLIESRSIQNWQMQESFKFQLNTYLVSDRFDFTAANHS